jgi:hypothetical protein
MEENEKGNWSPIIKIKSEDVLGAKMTQSHYYSLGTCCNSPSLYKRDMYYLKPQTIQNFK